LPRPHLGGGFSHFAILSALLEERGEILRTDPPARAATECNPVQLSISQPTPHGLLVDLKSIRDLVDGQKPVQETLLMITAATYHYATPYHDKAEQTTTKY